MSVRQRTKQQIFSSRNKRKPPHGRAHKRVAAERARQGVDPYEKAKNRCQQQTHLRGGIYAPQMANVCNTNNPTAPFSRRMPCGEAAGSSKRERLGVLSFAISLRRGKEMATKQTANAHEVQCERPVT